MIWHFKYTYIKYNEYVTPLRIDVVVTLNELFLDVVPAVLVLMVSLRVINYKEALP